MAVDVIMQSQKYSTIQFTKDDLARIKEAQHELESELGIKLSMAQTVIYGIDKVKKVRVLEKRLARLEANSNIFPSSFIVPSSSSLSVNEGP